MSRSTAKPDPEGGWLNEVEQRAWLAYIRIQLRMAYEMNRQLLADSGVSLPDCGVLTALSVAENGRMPITVLAGRWRTLHHFTTSPSKIGDIVKAALVLTHFEHGRLT